MFIIPQYYYVIAAMYNDSLNLEYCSTSEKTTLIYIFSNLFLGPLFYHWVFLCFRIKKNVDALTQVWVCLYLKLRFKDIAMNSK